MTTATIGRPAFRLDRLGVPLFTSRTAAAFWLASDGRALQCPGCCDIHDDAFAAFDCCDRRSAYPVRPAAHDPHTFQTVTAHDL